MGKNPLTVVSLELGPGSLKIVELSRAERRVISAGIFPLSRERWNDHGHLAAQIRSAFAVTLSGAPGGVIASAPLGTAWLRTVDVPHDADPRDHAAWDMSRYLGRELDDMAFDVVPGPERGRATDGDPRARCVVAAAFPRAEAIALRETIESATGLPLSALDVDAAALVNAFAANYPELAPERTVLIQAHAAAVSVLRVQDGRLHEVSLRRDAAGALREDADDAERAEGLLRLALDLAESLRAEADDRKPRKSPEQVLLGGDLARDADFRELLRTHLPLPFSLLNPFRNVPGPDPTEHPGAYPGAPLAAAVGLALRLAEDLS